MLKLSQIWPVGSPFTLAPVSFDVPIILGACSCFLALQDVPGSSCSFLVPGMLIDIRILLLSVFQWKIYTYIHIHIITSISSLFFLPSFLPFFLSLSLPSFLCHLSSPIYLMKIISLYQYLQFQTNTTEFILVFSPFL